MPHIVKFDFGHFQRYYNMDQLIYAEPRWETPDWQQPRVKHLQIVLVFVGQKEDVKLIGSNAERFIEYINAHADTMRDLMPALEEYARHLRAVASSEL
jgi:hypothetical protein